MPPTSAATLSFGGDASPTRFDPSGDGGGLFGAATPASGGGAGVFGATTPASGGGAGLFGAARAAPTEEVKFTPPPPKRRSVA